MFKPEIVAFVCNWGLPTGIEIPSPSRVEGYPKAHIVRVMCAGGIDPVIVLETFAQGADGVLVVGCPSHDCHYINGILQAEQKIKILRILLSTTNLDPERLRLERTYSIDIEGFAKIIDDFRDKVFELGSSPLVLEETAGKALLNVLAAKNAAAGFRLRVLAGRGEELTKATNVYGEKIPQEEYDEMLEEIVKEEFARYKIHLLAKQKALSVKAIAATMDETPSAILRNIVDMRRKGMITLDHVAGTTPFYRSLEVETK